MLKMLHNMKSPLKKSVQLKPILVNSFKPLPNTISFLGLGISATKTGNNFDIKVLTGMKSFNVKGTQNGNRFTGTVYSKDNKEVMTTSGTLTISNDGFKLDTKLVDSASKKEAATLTADIGANVGKGLTADIGLTTPDKSKSFKINCKFSFYLFESLSILSNSSR